MTAVGVGHRGCRPHARLQLGQRALQLQPLSFTLADKSSNLFWGQVTAPILLIVQTRQRINNLISPAPLRPHTSAPLHTTQSECFCSARITGASLMASGRVPKTDSTFNISTSPLHLCSLVPLLDLIKA